MTILFYIIYELTLFAAACYLFKVLGDVIYENARKEACAILDAHIAAILEIKCKTLKEKGITL